MNTNNLIAYDTNLLDNRAIVDNAEQWHRHGNIDDEKLSEIRANFPDKLYTPNWAVKIGLAIFGSILFSASSGFLGLFAFELTERLGGAFLGFMIGIGGFVVLEMIVIRDKHHYQSGLDNIFLYASLVAVLLGIWQIFDDAPLEVYCFMTAIACLIATVRYLDSLTAVTGLLALLWGFASLINRIAGDNAALILPFSGMLFALATYFLVKKGRRNPANRFYALPFDLLEAVSLLIFYAAGNFFVIKTGAVEIFHFEKVPAPYFFWAFTMAIPILMIVFGLKRKDRILLDIGLFLVAISIATFRNFYSVMPVGQAASMAGTLLLGIAWASIRYLKKDDRVFTFAPDGGPTALQVLQRVVVNQAETQQQGNPF